jgi:short-subunit dehydrogenase
VTAEQSAALRGSAVVVIGGSSGIGYEIARQAQTLGAVLTITGRDASRLATSAQELGGLPSLAVISIASSSPASRPFVLAALRALRLDPDCG